MLAASGVQEILVFCCFNARAIEDYIHSSKWGNVSVGGVTVQCITSQMASSAGDALRTIHETNAIRTDFVLVTGDVISNLDLKPIIERHIAEREKDPSLVMTPVFKRQRPSKINFYHDKDYIWTVIDPNSNQLLYYENDKTSSNSNSNNGGYNTCKPLDIDIEKLKSHPNTIVESDLVDCHIDICSPEVLDVFIENFDFQDIRDDFLKTFALHDEIAGYTVQPYIISHEYAARVSSLRTYDTVSRDIVKRWVFPITPDSNFTGSTRYKFHRPNNYYENNVTLARSCVIGEDVVIGAKSSIGEGSRVTRTVLGRNVVIGRNVIIQDSYVWDNAIIEDGARITRSIVCNDARIGSGSILSRGSVVSSNVVVGEKVTIAEHVRLTTIKDDYDGEDGFDDFDEDYETDHVEREIVTREEDVGEGGVGHACHVSLDNKINLLGISDEELKNDEESLDDEEDEFYIDMFRPVPVDTVTAATFMNQPELSNFMLEAEQSVTRAIKENHSYENAKLELQALKLAYDVNFSDCAQAVLLSMTKLMDDGKRSPTDMLKTLKLMLNSGTKDKTSWGDLLSSMVIEEADQLDLMCFLLDYCKGEGKKYGPLMHFIIQFLYEEDILTEEAVIEWYESIMEANDETEQRLVGQMKTFIEWLRTAEEESDDDDDDDDDESDED